MLAPGALRLLYLQILVDDGGYVGKMGRASAATNALSRDMRVQSATMRQYHRDMALTAGLVAVSLGALAMSYARVQEKAARTVIATNDLQKITTGWNVALAESIDKSVLLAKHMKVTTERAQDVSLAIEEAGVRTDESKAAYARASIMLSRLTGDAVSADDAFKTLYRSLDLTTANAEQSGLAATFFASALAIAGNESSAGVAELVKYVDTLKEIAVAAPITTQELFALSGALSSIAPSRREASRTAIIRLFTKGTAVEQQQLYRLMEQHSDVGSAENAAALFNTNAPEYLFELARAVRNATAVAGEGASEEDRAKILQERFGLTNARDIVLLTNLIASEDTYRRTMELINEEQERYIEGGDKATTIYQAHSSWLGTLTGQWETLKSALSVANTEMGTFLSLVAGVPMAAVGGLAQTPGIFPMALLAGGAWSVSRMQGVAAVRRSRLYAPADVGGAFLAEQRSADLDLFRRMNIPTEGMSKGERERLLKQIIAETAFEARSAGDDIAARRLANDIAARTTAANVIHGVAMGWPHSRNMRREPMVVDPEVIRARRTDVDLKPRRPTAIPDRGVMRNTLDDILFTGIMAQSSFGRLGTRFQTSALGRRLMMMRTNRALTIADVGLQAAGMSRFSQRGATTLARFGMGNLARGLVARGAVGGLAAAGAIPVIGTLVAGLALLTPVLRNINDALTGVIEQGGALSGVLRVVRFIFRTLELGGALISRVFGFVWEMIRRFGKLLGFDMAPLGDVMDNLDAWMKDKSERLRPSEKEPADATTRDQRTDALAGLPAEAGRDRGQSEGGDTYNYNYNVQSSDVGDALRKLTYDAGSASRGATRYTVVGGV